MRVMCGLCETIFKEEFIEGMSNCPVCGAVFDEEEESDYRLWKRT